MDVSLFLSQAPICKSKIMELGLGCKTCQIAGFCRKKNKADLQPFLPLGTTIDDIQPWLPGVCPRQQNHCAA